MTQFVPQFQTFIVKGKAIVTPSGLRCHGPRKKKPDLSCNKLLVKKNSLGQMSGAFLCSRCDQKVEVEIRLVPSDPKPKSTELPPLSKTK